MPRKRTRPQCPITGLSVINKRCKCRACLAVRASDQRALRRAKPEMVKAGNLRPYGLTLDDWKEMVVAHDNRCAACGQEELGKNQHGRMALAIDHDHDTGAVRGLLCHRCNRALGLLADSALRLKQLMEYRSRYA